VSGTTLCSSLRPGSIAACGRCRIRRLAIRPSERRPRRRAIVLLVEPVTLRKPFKALPGDLATGNEAGVPSPAPSRNEIA